MVAVTTEALPARDRFEYWRDAMSRQFVRLRLEHEGTSPFHCETEIKAIDGLVVSRFLSSGGTAMRTAAEIADSPVPYYSVSVHVGGPAAIRVGGETKPMTPGDITFVDVLREFTIGADHQFQCLAVLLPKDWIDGRVTRPDLVHGSVVRRDNPLAALIAGYLRSGFELADEFTADAASLFAAHSMELFAQALSSDQAGKPAPTDAVRQALFVRACRIVARKFGDPGLTPTRIANELGISRRLLDLTFAGQRLTVMKHVFAERVRRAATLLAAPGARHRTITEIAYACGFNDSAHFSRVFAEHMQVTPSEWRKQALH